MTTHGLRCSVGPRSEADGRTDCGKSEKSASAEPLVDDARPSRPGPSQQGDDPRPSRSLEPSCLKQAGRDPTELSKAVFERANQRKEHSRAFGLAIAQKLRQGGHPVAFDGRLNVLDFQDLRMRLRLLWSTNGEVGQVWRIRVERISRDVDFDLLVRMNGWFQAKDYFVVPPADVVVRFPQLLTEQIPIALARFSCQSPQALMERIRTLSERRQVVTAASEAPRRAYGSQR